MPTGLKDFYENYKVVQRSTNIPPKRKAQLLQNFLLQIDGVFFQAPDYQGTDAQIEAQRLYEEIRDYLQTNSATC